MSLKTDALDERVLGIVKAGKVVYYDVLRAVTGCGEDGGDEPPAKDPIWRDVDASLRYLEPIGRIRMVSGRWWAWNPIADTEEEVRRAVGDAEFERLAAHGRAVIREALEATHGWGVDGVLRRRPTRGE